jgi:hypothetical protein
VQLSGALLCLMLRDPMTVVNRKLERDGTLPTVFPQNFGKGKHNDCGTYLRLPLVDSCLQFYIRMIIPGFLNRLNVAWHCARGCY